jgi:hypothetical protein
MESSICKTSLYFLYSKKSSATFMISLTSLLNMSTGAGIQRRTDYPKLDWHWKKESGKSRNSPKSLLRIFS